MYRNKEHDKNGLLSLKSEELNLKNYFVLTKAWFAYMIS